MLNPRSVAHPLPLLLSAPALLSPQDASFNARDRFVRLKWDYLKPMLDIIVKYNYDKAAYRSIFDKRNVDGKDLGYGAGVSYDFVGGKLTEDEPIWCGEDCKKNLGIPVPAAPAG